MRSFWKKEDGYVLVLMLLFMPVFVGFSLLVIDVSRGNSAQSDLYAAADSLALAAARELDGGSDSIDRAKDAMLELTNSVSFLAPGGEDVFIRLRYEDDPSNEFNVIFLQNIPDDDDDPIDQAWINAEATNDGALADYVLVEAQSRDLRTVFFNPLTLITSDVPIAATAVATRLSAACNVTPVYLCNPFEVAQTGDEPVDNKRILQQKFLQGELHGRLFSMHPKGNQTEAPGNFGFLQVLNDRGQLDNGLNTIRDIFAGGFNPTCYSNDTVSTMTGARTSIRNGINVRFDMYEAPFSATQGYVPAANVRKGYVASDQGPASVCNVEENPQELVRDAVTGEILGTTTDGVYEAGVLPEALRYLDNRIMVAPGGVSDGEFVTTDGAFVGQGEWDFDKYLLANYSNLPDVTNADGTLNQTAWEAFVDTASSAAYNSAVSGKYSPVTETVNGVTTSTLNTFEPSRYDIYRFEMEYETTVLEKVVTGSGNNQTITYVPSTSVKPLYQHFSPGGESGLPVCTIDENTGNGAGGVVPDPPPVPPRGEPDRRIIFAAIIDCNSPENEAQGGGQNTYKVNSFASVFMTDPMSKNGVAAGEDRDSNINLEFIDLSSSGGGGQIENFVRDEAVLVR